MMKIQENAAKNDAVLYNALFAESLLRRHILSVALTIFISAISWSVLAGAPIPEIPKGKGEQCVEETQFMRTNHMELLLHQRDDTLRRGIRTKKHSLKECIDCHVVSDNNNQAVGADNPKHFCRQCHDYAAVNIDCFGCHASKPSKKSASAQTGANDWYRKNLGIKNGGFPIVMDTEKAEEAL